MGQELLLPRYEPSLQKYGVSGSQLFVKENANTVRRFHFAHSDSDIVHDKFKVGFLCYIDVIFGTTLVTRRRQNSMLVGKVSGSRPAAGNLLEVD